MSSNNQILKLRNVSKAFGALRAVDDVSFDVLKGEILGIIGPNGAGKTTLFNLVTQVYHVSRGEIWFKGQRIDKVTPYMVCRLGVARTFQDLQLFTNMSVIENVMVGCHRWCHAGLLEDMFHFGRHREEETRISERTMKQLSRFGLAEKAFVHPASLPLRERKLVGIARALASEPDCLLLDEPAGGLSLQEIEELSRVITTIVRDRGITIVLVEHRMEMVMSLSDRVIVMNFGHKIAEGTPTAVQKDKRVVSAYLGEERDWV